MIKVYPSMLPGEPVETHSPESGTLGEWLSSAYPDGYHPGMPQPFVCILKGQQIPPSRWDGVPVTEDIHLHFKAQGGAIKSIGNIISKVVSTVFGFLLPSAPKMGKQANTPQGQQLEVASAKANVARLNAVIPEGAGLWRRYPDYLVPPRRYFVDKKEQEIELFLCVGAGKYQLQPSRAKVGETPLLSLGGSAQFQFYQPGQDVSGDRRSYWWHSCDEVGGTSSGTAGLEMRATFPIEQNSSATAYLLDEYQVTAQSGAGEFPEGWTAGLLARIEAPKQWTVSSDGTRSVISGDATELDPFVGMVIEIAGDNFGEYVIHSYVPAVPDAAGSASTLTGSVAPATFDFSVVNVSFDVLLGSGVYPISLTTDLGTMSGLIAELNAQLPSIIVASENGGLVRLSERAPFSGLALTVSAGASDVFGASPVSVVGAETTTASPAEITLNYDNGSPVSGFPNGAASMTIGYRGLRYRLISASSTQITVERITDTGITDIDWPGFDTRTSTTTLISLDGSNLEGDWCGPFSACPEGEVTELVEWDLFFPKGLGAIDSKGGYLKGWTVRAEMQYRDFAVGGAWSSVSETLREADPDQIGFTRSLELPYPMRPELRYRRVGAKNTQTNVFNDMQWYGLRSRIASPASYEGVTTMAVRIRGGSRIAAQSENLISVEALRVLPVRAGGEWTVETPTRSISAYVAHVAKSVGYTDDELDLDELDRLDDLWAARGDTFDYFEQEGTVKEAINKALRAGFAEFTIDRGRIRPIRDEPRSQFEHMYTPQNMTRRLIRDFSAVKPDEADGVDVEYTDQATWATATVQCRLPGDLGIKTTKIKLEGVISRTRAWRIGMRIRRGQAFRRWQMTFSTELDALNSRYMSYAALADDVPGYGKSSLLLGRDGDYLIVSEPMNWVDGETHVVAIRNADGTLNGPYPATRGDDDHEIIASGLVLGPIVEGQELPHVLFGRSDRWTFPALITQIRPNGFDDVSVTAMNYDERVYADDDNSP